MHKILFVLFLISSSIYSNPLNETTLALKDNVSEKHEDESIKFMLLGSFLSVSNPDTGESLSGPGASFQALYVLGDKFAIGGGAGTTMNETGAGAATILNWAFTYSLTGRLKSTKSTYSLNGRQIFSGTNSIAEGFRAQFLLSQYYFNATRNTVPYAGLGGQIHYDKYFKSIGYNGIFGVRIDQLFNNDASLMPISLVFGLLI